MASGSYAGCSEKPPVTSMMSPAICTAVNSTCTMKPRPAPIATSVTAPTMMKPGDGAVGSPVVTLSSSATASASASAPFTAAGMALELNGGASSTKPAARAVARSSPTRVTAGTERSTVDQVRPSSAGSMSNSCWVKLTISESTQLPDTSSAIATAIIFGTKDSVCSWIWVAAWNSEIRKPTSSAVSRTGAATLAASIIVCSASSVTWVSVMALPRPVRVDQCGGDQRPPVDDDEQQQLERQRHDRRRHHHHAHRHQRRADQHVHHQEGDEDDQPDDERALELGEDEGGDEHGHADLALVLGRVLAGEVDHQLELVLAGVLEEEALERDDAGVVGLRDGHLAVEVRLHLDVVDYRPTH